MAAKYRITDIVLSLVNKKRFGLVCEEYDERKLLQHYLNSLDCSPKTIIPLEKEECDKTTQKNKCLFYITDIGKDEHIDITYLIQVMFYVGNSYNGKAPYTYQWDYDTTLFKAIEDEASGEDKPILILHPKHPELVINTNITVTCTDSEGCITTKTCVYATSIIHNPLTGEDEFISKMDCRKL